MMRDEIDDFDEGPKTAAMLRYMRTAAVQMHSWGQMYFLIYSAPYIKTHMNKSQIKHKNEPVKRFLEVLEVTIDPEHAQNMLELQDEILLTRSVDNFLFYISQVLLETLRQRPEAIMALLENADKAISIQEVLQSEKEQIIQRVIEDKIEQLSYSGLPEIIRHLNSKLKLNINTNIPIYNEVCDLVELRNIIVHNGRIVNKRFLKKTGKTDVNEGSKYPLDGNLVLEASHHLTHFAAKLDEQIIAHFVI